MFGLRTLVGTGSRSTAFKGIFFGVIFSGRIFVGGILSGYREERDQASAPIYALSEPQLTFGINFDFFIDLTEKIIETIIVDLDEFILLFTFCLYCCEPKNQYKLIKTRIEFSILINPVRKRFFGMEIRIFFFNLIFHSKEII